MTDKDIAAITANIVIAYAEQVSPYRLPDFIRETYQALANAHYPLVDDVEEPKVYTPAVPIRSSVKPDHIISLIDGKPYKMLKRHLSNHGLTPAEYRARYGLKADYPMVAPAYAEKRREIAKTNGLGNGAGRGRGKKSAKAGGKGE